MSGAGRIYALFIPDSALFFSYVARGIPPGESPYVYSAERAAGGKFWLAALDLDGAAIYI